MDQIDKRIIELLANDATVTATEIGKVVNLSIPAINKRIQNLKKDGVIRAFTVLTDEKKVNKPIIAYILLVIKYGEGVDNLLKYIKNDKDVLECYAITGEYDYIIKVCATDIEEFENKLLYIKKQKGVMKSHTLLTLQEHKFTPTTLP